MSSATASPRQTPRQSSGESPTPVSTTSYLSYPLSYAYTGLLRRISGPQDTHPSLLHTNSLPVKSSNDNMLFNPPRRYRSPYQPPPLASLKLTGIHSSTPASAQLLSRALAEEIRLLLPPRLQLHTEWSLVYSVEQDGVSLATLYKNCDVFKNQKMGFVLVVRDSCGGVFGAYLSDAPRPSPRYYGTGECFLWRASLLSNIPLLASLPPPPSEDTTYLQRSTTISAGPTQERPFSASALSPPAFGSNPHSGTSTPERIRFKAFPYSGLNEYMMLCDNSYLSVGGGDGHYGLWLDDVFEKGISSSCPTFGNEPLSDEGNKFDILGVELWSVGS
ncbi:MAG: oxidation resistance protein 1 [Trizodia sp. TS-e1964]|nr:MAG: oxidation resistance protein 1 [Trizodia sp. TS-e1964]